MAEGAYRSGNCANIMEQTEEPSSASSVTHNKHTQKLEILCPHRLLRPLHSHGRHPLTPFHRNTRNRRTELDGYSAKALHSIVSDYIKE